MSKVPVQVVSGPLASHAAGFAAVLTADGYGLSSVRLRLWQMDHISRWLQEEGLTAADLTAVVASRFVAAHRAKGYSSWVSERSMQLPLGYLRWIGAAPAPLSGVGQDALGVLLADYSSYLARERGLAAGTVRAYAATGQLFLSGRLGVVRDCSSQDPQQRSLTEFFDSGIRVLVSSNSTLDACGMRAQAASGTAPHAWTNSVRS